MSILEPKFSSGQRLWV